MPLDAKFIRAAQSCIDPHEFSSGTESTALMLYGLVKMHRPRTIVEHGSAYSTLCVLRALADNVADVEDEQRAFLAGAQARGIMDHLTEVERGREVDAPILLETARWLSSPGRACAANPGFYSKRYEPRLWSFGSHAHGKADSRVSAAVRELRLDEYYTFVQLEELRKEHVPPDALPIDLASTARDDYREFFSEMWNCLSPYGGLMVLHNVPAQPDLYEAVHWMKEQRRTMGDLEMLILPEPHRMGRGGCAILRRYSLYRPIFGLSTRNIGQIYQDLRLCADRAQPAPPTSKGNLSSL